MRRDIKRRVAHLDMSIFGNVRQHLHRLALLNSYKLSQYRLWAEFVGLGCHHEARARLAGTQGNLSRADLIDESAISRYHICSYYHQVHIIHDASCRRVHNQLCFDSELVQHSDSGDALKPGSRLCGNHFDFLSRIMGGTDDGDRGLRIAVRKNGIAVSDPAAAYLADLL